MADALSLKRLRFELETLLAPLSEQELREAVSAYATSLPASARAGFLTALAAACTPRQPTGPRDRELVAAIDAFTADVQSGMYCDDWGWDSEIGHERAFGDESWAPRMDGLFSRAAGAFLAGRHDLAADAYGRLFAALALEGDEGPLYSYETSPAESLTTDLTEAGARYLRSRYETASDPAQAAEAIAGAWLHELPYGHRPGSLTAIREALPEDLPCIDDFCPRWTQALVKRSGGHDPLRSALLREAAELAGGTETLAQATRYEGSGQPQAYLDLVDALTGRGEMSAALEACEEGLRIAERPGGDRASWAAYQWAELADRGAQLAEPESATHLCTQAFALGASAPRLVALYRAAEAHQAGTGPQAAGEAADRLARGAPGLAHYHLNDFRAQALLLAGRVDDALELQASRGVTTHGSPDVILTVLPYVLAAACGAAAHRDWSRTVLRTMLGRTAYLGRTIRYDHELDADGAATSAKALADLLEELLCERSASAADRSRWLRDCRRATDEWARGILNGKQRAHYADAARLAAAVTEAETIADGDSTYFDSLLDTYRRYTAFRREAEGVRRGSVLL